MTIPRPQESEYPKFFAGYIGKVPDSEGAYVATGHSVWGILNAPATGEAMAELITEGRTRAVDLSPFDPSRLPPLDPASPRRAGIV